MYGCDQGKISEHHIRGNCNQNNFFGEKITVSGLITGQDLIEQLSGRKLGDRLLIPCNMLRSGEDVFLDDITITELSEKLGKEIIVVDPGGADLVSAVLIRLNIKNR